MQKFLTTIITMLILYMIVSNYFSNNLTEQSTQKIEPEKEQNSQPVIEGNIVEKTVSKVINNVIKTDEGRQFIENLITTSNSPLINNETSLDLGNNDLLKHLLNFQDFGEKNHKIASCGHLVKVNYSILSPNSLIIHSATEKFILGTKHDIPGLDAVICGMSIGTTRQATIPPAFISKNYKGHMSYKISVKLLDIAPQNYLSSAKIFDDKLSYDIPLTCGQNAKFDLKITKLANGKILKNSLKDNKKITMKIGSQTYPLVISHAMHGKSTKGTRTVIAKGKSFKSTLSENSAIFNEYKLNDDEFYMLEIFNAEKILPISNNLQKSTK